MKRLLSRFSADRRGNVAVLFGIALLPIMAVVGAALDYARVSGTQVRVQAALDAASLAVARDSRRLDGAALTAAANKAFAGNFAGEDGLTLSAVAAAKTGNTIRLSISASLKTTITKLIGYETMDFSVAATTTWNEPLIEIALVLDNTGSMASSGKMAALKTAVHALLNDLEANRVSTDQVKVAIVPFDTQVNIGTAYRNESWMRFDSTDLPSHVDSVTKANWQGCLTDRDQPNDVGDAAPTNTATYYRGVKCDNGALAQVQPLTSTFSTLRTTVDAMQPAGNTNVTIGVQMGLATLSANLPFTQTGTGDPNLLRYMVILTDGDNTESRYVRSSTRNASTLIDARTKLACEAVKAAGVTVFTVRVINGDEALLRSCASDPSLYFPVTSASGIGDAFRAITSLIKRMRLSS